ncbi:MAG: winged helix-turn-helix domain-containing protein [Candidatus Hodarchaeales archaeon]|jgi:DNA-binding transcriptional ArsR family regulator
MAELDEQILFEILSHSTRRKILRILAQAVIVNYSDLQDAINQSPGVIYHHLEKLRKQGILQQRSTKEYELTPMGLNIVEYMDNIKEKDLADFVTREPIQRYFLLIPLARIVKNSPFHWIMEVGLLLILTSAIQIDFPIQVIGPFLFPSSEPFLNRLVIQVLSFGLMIVLILSLAYLLAPSTSGSSDLMLFRGILIFPFLSSLCCFVLWGVSLILTPVPSFFYWLLTLLLHGGYAYFSIHLLLKIKRISFERSLIIALIQSYTLLIVFFLLS